MGETVFQFVAEMLMHSRWGLFIGALIFALFAYLAFSSGYWLGGAICSVVTLAFLALFIWEWFK